MALTRQQQLDATAWLKALPRHMLREHIKRAMDFGSDAPHAKLATAAKLRDVLQQTACLAEAIHQLLDEADRSTPDALARTEGGVDV